MRACLDCNARVCYTETIRMGPAAGGTRAGAKEGDKMTESRLLPQRESLTVEFKSDKARLPDGEIFETVVGLANTEGGDLYLGVEDSGAVSGLHRDHRNPVALSTYIASNTVPPLSVRTELVPTEPPVLRISVPKMEAGIASTTTGKTLHRRLKADGSPETVPLYPYEFASRLADLRRLDYTALPVPEASAADFDPLERERLRRILVQNTAEKGLLQLSDDALYRALGLVRRHDGRECPTVAGLLLLGRPDVLARLLPTAASSFQELEGTRVRVNEDFLLPVLAALEKQFAYLDVRNGSTELALGPFRLSVPDFDRQAVREAIVNAYCHRDYARMQRVRLCLTEEGLTIANPGGFRSGTNLAWLYDAEPDSRNLLLSDVLKRIGLAERTGRGIDRIYEGCLQYGRPLPDYSRSSSATVSLFLAHTAPDPQFTRIVAEAARRGGAPLSLHLLLVLHCLRDRSPLSVPEAAAATGLAPAEAQLRLQELVQRGLALGRGNGPEQRYAYAPTQYGPHRTTVHYVRESGTDSREYLDTVLALARQRGSLTRADVTSALPVNENQAYRLLKKLAAQGRLQLVGKGRYAKYIVP